MNYKKLLKKEDGKKYNFNLNRNKKKLSKIILFNKIFLLIISYNNNCVKLSKVGKLINNKMNSWQNRI